MSSKGNNYKKKAGNKEREEGLFILSLSLSKPRQKETRRIIILLSPP
jgi:hypothetical protein